MQELATEASTKDLFYYLAQIWSTIVVGLIVYLGGVSAKRLTKIWVPASIPEARQPMWFRLWHATIDWHPVFVAGLVGLVPWPVPEFIRHWWVRVLWFMGVGAVSGQLYKAMQRTFESVPGLVREAIRKWFGLNQAPGAPAAPPAAEEERPDAGDRE